MQSKYLFTAKAQEFLTCTWALSRVLFYNRAEEQQITDIHWSMQMKFHRLINPTHPEPAEKRYWTH